MDMSIVLFEKQQEQKKCFLEANKNGGIRWIHGEEVTEIVSKYRTTIKKPSTFYEQIQQQQQQQ